MNTTSSDYSLFLKFLETYTPVGFQGINRNDLLLTELEEMMEERNQFFYVADIIQMKVLFTSNRSTQMIGIEPTEVSPYHFMEATHPDDLQRLNRGRAKIIKMAQELFISREGDALFSTNFKMRKPGGEYSNILIQSYIYCSSIPYRTVFYLKIHTNIDWCKKIKHGYHYYIGNNIGYFKYPDDELLSIGHSFSDREFEIIKLIELGMSTEQIAGKLFLSPYTVNTHRGNILKKTGKAHIFELIHELQEKGIL
jgi:DNA-binding CsgD family transcriptional regulator